MIKQTMTIIILCSLICLEAQAWEKREHQQLGDSAYFSVMGQCCQPFGDTAFLLVEDSDSSIFPHQLWQGMTFGQICEQLAENDLVRSRFHDRGKTILDQLRSLTTEHIDVAWNEISAPSINNPAAIFSESDIFPPDFSAGNVVSTYLLYHLLALRMAESAARSETDVQMRLRRAMVLEAIAQGYLADAFSAGHILTPVSDLFEPLHPRNTKEAHNFYRSQGVYVINSLGDAWQTFGDGLMHWYVPTYRPVYKACCYSLKELLAVFYQTGEYLVPTALKSWLNVVTVDIDPDQMVSSWLLSRNGDSYFTEWRMPTLMLLPMPVAASWSFRTQEKDEHGIRRRYHFPQLREEGLHDPDLTAIDREFLYSRSAIPDWLIPPLFLRAKPVAPDSLIRSHPDWASVSWIQNRYAPPSYKGLLIHVGGQLVYSDGDSQTGGIAAIGYGLWDDLLLIKNVSISTAILPSAYEPERLLLVPSAGFGVPFSIIQWFKTLRIDAGAAFGLRSKYDAIGGMFAIGIDSKAWPIHFTNAGLTWRLKYQWFYLDRKLNGPALELILH
jgi:hypothetical protein